MAKDALFSRLSMARGDSRPSGGALSYHAQPGLRELAEMRTNRAASASYHAAYIGCIVYVLRTHGQVLSKALQAALGPMNGRALSVMSRHLPKPKSQGLAAMVALLQENAPDLYARSGFGDVLEAFRDGKPASHLYAAEIMAIAGDRDADSLARQSALEKLFPLPPKKNTKTAPKEQTRTTPLEDLLPLVPNTVFDAIAQEEILQDTKNHKTWANSGAEKRMALISKRAETLRASIREGKTDQQTVLLKKFNAAARGLLAIQAKLTREQEPAHMAPLTALKTAYDKEPENDAETTVRRRMGHLLRFAPQGATAKL